MKWKILRLLSLALLALSVLFFSVCLKAQDGPLTEPELRQWAEDKDKETVVGAMIQLALNSEKQALIYKTEKADWMTTEKELRNDIRTTKDSLKKTEGFLDQERKDRKGKTRSIKIRASLIAALGWAIGGAFIGNTIGGLQGAAILAAADGIGIGLYTYFWDP